MDKKERIQKNRNLSVSVICIFSYIFGPFSLGHNTWDLGEKNKIRETWVIISFIVNLLKSLSFVT